MGHCYVHFAFVFTLSIKSYITEYPMTNLQNNVNDAIGSKCAFCAGCNTSCDHSNSALEVTGAITKLKHAKGVGSPDISADHLINAGYLQLSKIIIYTIYHIHGISPNDMLLGTMVPIPKGRWTTLCMQCCG